MRKERDRQIKQGLIAAPPPDAVARTSRVAREVGSPPAHVEGDEDAAERLSQTARLSSLAERYPAIGKFAVNNPRGIAAARDDAKSLSLLGRAWEGIKTVRARVGVVGTFNAGGLLNDLYGVGEQAQDIIGAPVLAGLDALGVDVSRAMRNRERSRAQRREYFDRSAQAVADANRGSNYVTERLLLGGEFAVPSLMAVLTGGATSAASVFGLTVGAQSFEDARAKGLDVPTAIRYGIEQGAVEAGTEKIPAGTLVDLIARKTPWGKAFVRELGQEMTGEQVATYLQDFSDWAVLPENRDKTLADFARERPQAALDTALAVTGGTTATTGAIGAAQRATDATRAVAGRVREARQARATGEFVDRMEKAVAGSKLHKRDPEAFRSLMREHAEEAGARNVFIPAEAIRQFEQSDSYDPDANPFDDFAVSEADVSGGDVVMPIEDALTDLVGTPAWEAVKDHVRLTEGGMSRAEAAEWEGNADKIIGDIADRMAATAKDDASRKAVRDKLIDDVAAQFGTSYTSPAARKIAEIAVWRAERRAARRGMDLLGNEFSGFEVRQVMPEGVREAVKADQLDLVINAMRGRGDVEIGQGPSLLEWINARGGLNDTGGDLASMGLPKGMIRDFNPDQGALSGLSGEGVFGLDSTFADALSAGYFPQLEGVSRDTYDDALDGSALLLDAISAELAGSPRYASVKRDWHREAGDDLRQMLEASGLDPDQLSDADVRAAVERMDAERADGRGFEQLPDTIEIDGVERPTRNSEGQPIAGSEEAVRAFWAWFGDSKVVDDQGRPLVVYHGTRSGQIEAFDPAALGSNTKAPSATQGFFFAGSESTSLAYVDRTLAENDRETADGVSSGVDNLIVRLAEWADQSEPEFATALRGTNYLLWHSPDDPGVAAQATSYDPEDVDGFGGYIESVIDEVEWLADDVEGEGRAHIDAEVARMRELLGEYQEIDLDGVADEDAGSTILPAYLKIESPAEVDQGGSPYRETSYYEAITRGKSDGADGTIIRNTYDGGRLDDIYVAFSPTQIKSVNNRGTFDPTDARILYQGTGVDLTPGGGSKTLAVGDATITYGVSGDTAEVILVSVPPAKRKSGAARAAMKQFLNATDAAGLTVFLTAEPMGKGGPKKAALEKFYKSLGFKANKGRNKDFRAMQGMVRQPTRSMQQEARGRIIFDSNKRIIELFQTRNLSTALHELSHMWLEELRFDAEQPDAPQQLKDDWAKVQSWFAANGHPIGEDGQIPTEAHELWARSGERYFMEGKAPTPALTRLFETFRSWLVAIYRTVDRLKAPITPEIREVFDRLLATDEEIAQVAEAQNLAALFKDAAEIGLSEPEFAAYQALVEDAKAGAHAKLLDKTMATIRRREQERYRDARATIKAEETERIDGSPIFKVLRLMKDQRISRDWLADRFGEDVFDLLPVRVPPLYSVTGSDPEVVAELSGYPSAHDMIEALIGAERAHRQAKEGGDQRSMRARAIDSATDAEFARRYGDPLNDGSIEREALAAVHSEMQGEVIAAEIRVLARKTGQRPTPYRIARDWARGKIRSGIIVDEASAAAIQRYARNAAKAGRAAEQAMLKQDVEEAFRQKQFQMINSALLAEAKEAGDEVEAAVKRLDKIARAKTRKSVDQDYLEQAQALLEAVDLRKRSQVGIDRRGKWEAWAAARAAEGFDVVTPEGFEAQLGQTNWTRLSVETLLALDEQVKQIMHLGRLKQTLIDRAEEREWDEIFGEVEANADGIGRKPPTGSFAEPSWWDSIKSRAATMDAALLKMEQVFDWLDQGKSDGVFNRIAFRPMAEAQAREQEMTRDYFDRIAEAVRAVPEKTVRSWADKITLDLIDPATGLPAVFTRQKVVAMALNWGNAGNRQRLADGYGWNEAGIERALMDNLTAEEWQFVQSVWDIIDTLWPSIEKMERAINGVAPDKVEAVEVVTPFGTLKGGYYPAIYDSALDYTAEVREGRKADLFEAKYVRATTRASATKDRAEAVKRPILLDLGVINRHLGEVIHDVTHREAVMRAHKFLTNPRVMRAVDETLGPEIRKQFRPWLQHIANSWAAERAGNEGIGRFLTKARANVTVVGMGFRFTTMLTQIAGYSNSVEVVGLGNLTKAIALTSAHPIETFEFAMERSDELRNRLDTLDRDIRLAIRQMAGEDSKLTAAKRFAFHGIGYMDRVVSVPTWLAGYNKAISEGMSEQDAAYAGDKAVRLSQGAGGAKDLASVATGAGRYGEALKLLTMFYSYLSTVYSRQRNLGRDVRRAGSSDIPALMARAWWLIVVPPLLAEILSGRGPDDDEDWAWWAFSKMLSQSLGAIPMVRDAVDPIYSAITGQFSFGYRLSPVQGAVESLVRVGKDINKVAEGKETKRATRDVLEAVGYTTGLVPGQMAASTQFLVDVGNGDADPETIGDWYTGITKGRMPED